MNIDLLRSIINSGSYASNAVIIQEEYKRVFKRDLSSTCPDKLKDAAFMIYARQKDSEDTRLYKLKPSKSVYDEKTRTAYNFVTITDDVAERVLAAHPEWVDRFRTTPL